MDDDQALGRAICGAGGNQEAAEALTALVAVGKASDDEILAALKLWGMFRYGVPKGRPGTSWGVIGGDNPRFVWGHGARDGAWYSRSGDGVNEGQDLINRVRRHLYLKRPKAPTAKVEIIVAPSADPFPDGLPPGLAPKLREAINWGWSGWDAVRATGATDPDLESALRERIGSNDRSGKDWSTAVSGRSVRFWDTAGGFSSRRRPTLGGADLVAAARSLLKIPFLARSSPPSTDAETPEEAPSGPPRRPTLRRPEDVGRMANGRMRRPRKAALPDFAERERTIIEEDAKIDATGTGFATPVPLKRAAKTPAEPTPAAVLDAKLAEAIDSAEPRWDRMRKGGAADMELAEVIRHRFVAIGSNVNGTSDWSCATSERGGLRFWDTRTGRKSRHRPTLAGAALVVAARMILGIPKPGEGCTAQRDRAAHCNEAGGAVRVQVTERRTVP